jgi:inosine-uridine nucleoside N-ribohydrolase
VSNEWNAPALDALNTWYGRPNIPVGVTAGAAPVPQNYSQMIAQRFPHSGRPEDGVALYRRLLRSQPDHSVTVLSIGALTTLAQLARTDRALVARKVAKTVIMGGEYPRASVPEWNFGLDLPATRFVVANWPTPVVYDGFEIGGQVFVGTASAPCTRSAARSAPRSTSCTGAGTPRPTAPGTRPPSTTPSTAPTASTV